jgi:hypothetical protein
VLANYILDHHPLLVSFSNTREAQWNKSRVFKYEASWAKMKEPQAVIKKVWRVKPKTIEPWKNFKCKINGCRNSLKIWVRKQAGTVEDQIKQKEQELKSIQMQENRGTSSQEDFIKEELNNLLEQEDIKWRQRAKENWLRFGDRNSKFFHTCANQKHRSSRISSIKDKNGELCTTKEGIEGAFVDYFNELFKSGENLVVDTCTEALDSRVTNAMNDKLLVVYTVEEISMALHQMPPLKSLGPDGFSSCFYQKNWATVHPEVCSAILHFLKTGVMDDSINNTHIALIPKTAKPSSVTKFRPISLCNVIYKLISKVLANRLKVVLPENHFSYSKCLYSWETHFR